MTVDRTEAPDPYAASVALGAPPPLRAFNAAGILDAADVHVALTLGELSGVDDGDVLLAAALAVRAPRLGHVFVDLASVSQTVTADLEGAGDADLDWPATEDWIGSLAAASTLVSGGGGAGGGGAGAGVGGAGAGLAPLRLEGSRLYLDKYWREERRLADALLTLAEIRPDIGSISTLAAQISALLPDQDDALQRAALACGVMRNLTVIAGGPGTGKTTTLAKLVELLQARAQVRGAPEPLIALCAPTGKAAARMQEAVGDGVTASTIHKLLGWLPGGRFRYNAANRLPHDVVIVDETSMVPLTLMSDLVQAVRTGAQLVLVGDPDQLAAIEAGAVLRDIVGPAADELSFSEGMRSLLNLATGGELPASAGERSFGDGVVVLRRGHRFGASIGALADAVRRGDADAALGALSSASAEITWLSQSDEQLREPAVSAYAAVVSAARAGDGHGAITALGSFRLLCAHRRGPYGVERWNRQIEAWLAEAIPGLHPDSGVYVGRPLMVTENDYELQLFNGDSGVIVAAPAAAGAGPAEPLAVFDSGGQYFAPSRLAGIETVYATTVHKSQGSQFDIAAVVLPEPSSRLLTRELLYTAVTRARHGLILVGSEASVRAAVQRPLARATALQELLWGAG